MSTKLNNYPMTWEQAVAWLRSQPDQEELVRACYFDDPLEAAAARFHASAEWHETRRRLSPLVPHGHALDVGAGRGIASYALARDGWDVSALEPDRSELTGAAAIESLARRTGCRIVVASEWGEALPFAANTFDVVYGRQVLHHARDLEAFAAEVMRVLRPSGRFLFAREHVLSSDTDRDKFLASHPLHDKYGGENAYTLERYVSALRLAGLRVDVVLNPLESDINLHPTTLKQKVEDLRSKAPWPMPRFLARGQLRREGRRMTHPGRLYSFGGTKR